MRKTMCTIYYYFNSSFINVRIDAEKEEGIKLANKYQITAYPTFLFLSSKGELIKRVEGAMSSDRFMTLAREIVEVQGSLIRD